MLSQSRRLRSFELEKNCATLIAKEWIGGSHSDVSEQM
jgi:hypothetical protein